MQKACELRAFCRVAWVFCTKRSVLSFILGRFSPFSLLLCSWLFVFVSLPPPPPLSLSLSLSLSLVCVCARVCVVCVCVCVCVCVQ